MRKPPSLGTTEQGNPHSRNLDRKPTREILRLINREDAGVARAVRREIPKIARAADRIADSLARGGRLFYVGAGTSGRLGVLDAAECPPTFGVPKTMVQGVIAGGKAALTRAVEGAEDSAALGARDLAGKKLTRDDVVVGVSASGSTPYVLGALEFARRRGAYTIGVTTNRPTAAERLAHHTIAPRTGPEIIAGSTRMKSGTAQKMVLNMLSTAAMIRLGCVYDNWMVNVARTNRKLERRALRILEEAAGASLSAARHALRLARHDLRCALVILKTGASVKEARDRLRRAGGNVRLAIEGRGRKTPGKRKG